MLKFGFCWYQTEFKRHFSIAVEVTTIHNTFKSTTRKNKSKLFFSNLNVKVCFKIYDKDREYKSTRTKISFNAIEFILHT